MNNLQCDKILKDEWFIMKAFKVMFSSDPITSVVAIILIAITGLTATINVTLLRWTLEKVTDILNHNGSYYDLLPIVFIMVLMMIILPVINMIAQLMKKRLQQKIRKFARVLVSHKLQRIEYVQFDHKEVYDLCMRTAGNAEENMSQTVFFTVELIKNIISAIGLSLIVIKIAWWTLPFSCLAALPMILIRLKKEDEMNKAEKERAVYERKAKYLSGLIIGKKSLKEIRLFNTMDHLRSMWWRYNEKSQKKERDILFRAGKKGAIINMIYGWGGTPISLVVLFCVTNGYITFADYMILGNAMGILGLIIAMHIPASFGKIRRCKYFWENLMRLLSIKDDIHYKIPSNKHINSERCDITFDNVFFSYPGCTTSVLNGMSFNIRTGEKVAIVGDNGAGKSTIIKLLLGLYKPDRGSVMINGMDVMSMHPELRRKLVTAVFQDYTKYAFTVRENIGFGNIDFMNDDRKVQKASRKGMSEEFISIMTNKYNTLLGSLYGEGTDISEGQWQKLSISRAFMSEAKVMILDEPTAALDPRSEADLYHSFLKIAKDKTCLLISHRLGSARIGDRILVVDRGSIIEDGKHEDLLVAQNKYSEMFAAQAQWYKGEVAI